MMAQCLWETLGAFAGTIAFAAMFNVKPKHYFMCGMVGAIGWIIYYLIHMQSASPMLAMFFASACVAAVSRYWSVEFKTPTTMYLIPGIFPLVPGSGIFYTAYYLFVGDNALMSHYGFLTLKMAVAIALGIGVAYSIPSKLYGWKQDSKVWFENGKRES